MKAAARSSRMPSRRQLDSSAMWRNTGATAGIGMSSSSSFPPIFSARAM